MGTVTHAMAQGLRGDQEDRCFVQEISGPGHNGWLLAVMDGHSGNEVSEYCREHLGQYFDLKDPKATEKVLRDLISTLAKNTAKMRAGTTISVACILESHKQVTVAVLGDSPVLVLSDDGKVHPSPDHNVRTNEAERRAVEKRGGKYRDGYIYTSEGLGLQLTRALGDAPLASILSREPDVYTIKHPVAVLLATDGITDPAHSDNDLMREVEERMKVGDNAEELLAWRRTFGLSDNATAVIWREQ